MVRAGTQTSSGRPPNKTPCATTATRRRRILSCFHSGPPGYRSAAPRWSRTSASHSCRRPVRSGPSSNGTGRWARWTAAQRMSPPMGRASPWRRPLARGTAISLCGSASSSSIGTPSTACITTTPIRTPRRISRRASGTCVTAPHGGRSPSSRIGICTVGSTPSSRTCRARPSPWRTCPAR